MLSVVALFKELTSVYASAGMLLEAHCDLLYPCDLDCEHCYLDEKARPQRSTAFWKDVFDQLAAMQVMILHLSGGEIFLRKDLFELVAYARTKGLLVCLKTHGGFVGSDEAKRLADLGVSMVSVSYYSHRPEVHDAITRKTGSHARTLAALRHLVAMGLHTRVGLTVMQRNVSDVPAVLRQCDELGVEVALCSEIHS
ncbi:MAG: radical SAM protein, partial [Myxococcota bacterium]|nr:radical SAM protein [Myxococcota bacterium]